MGIIEENSIHFFLCVILRLLQQWFDADHLFPNDFLSTSYRTKNPWKQSVKSLRIITCISRCSSSEISFELSEKAKRIDWDPWFSLTDSLLIDFLMICWLYPMDLWENHSIHRMNWEPPLPHDNFSTLPYYWNSVDSIERMKAKRVELISSNTSGKIGTLIRLLKYCNIDAWP